MNHQTDGCDESDKKPSSQSKKAAEGISRRKIVKTFAIAPFTINPISQAFAHIYETRTSPLAREDYIEFDVIRPIDLLRLNFRFYNCAYQRRDQFTFVQKDKRKAPAYMVVSFPSQHTLEQAYLEADNPANNEKPTLPARFIRAGNSRLVYELPTDFSGIPLTMDKLLDWSEYKLKVNYRARIQPLTLVKPELLSPSLELKNPNVKPGKPDKIKVPDPGTLNKNLAPNPKFKNQQPIRYSNKNLQKVFKKETLQPVDQKQVKAVVAAALQKVAPPGPLETAIEAPTRLIISPNQLNDFVHASAANDQTATDYIYPKSDGKGLGVNNPLNTNQGRIVELWHTRMGVKTSSGKINENDYMLLKTIRALWSTDYGSPGIEQPFRSALDSRDRHLLVRQTSDFGIDNYTPRPVQANRLMLSPLGAWLNFDGNFDYPDRPGKGLEILKWQHRSTMGRDQFVKIVQAGFLYPFGHKASLVKITERKVDPATKSRSTVSDTLSW